MNEKNTPWLDADDIKQKVSMEDLLSHYGLMEKMKRKGVRVSGMSPFRDEKHPSFSADMSTGRWNDFGGRPDNVPGNIIGFVQAMEQCSFRDALVFLHRHFIGETLADSDVGGQAPTAKKDDTPTAESSTRTEQTPTSRPEPPIENVPFGRELKGRTNIPPLFERGLTEETIKRWGVVYCTSGLMKGRIAFPIKNVKGEIMAYAGRAVKKADEEANGKYRFPPNFNKSAELFGIDRIANIAATSKAAKDYGLILVEGFIDAMKLEQEGFPNVVALMGTDFHEAQKALLLDPKLNPTRRVTLFLDNDEAGKNAKRKIAQSLIHDAFVRYINWSLAPEDMFEPEHFDKVALVRYLV
jgi:DNA primase